MVELLCRERLDDLGERERERERDRDRDPDREREDDERERERDPCDLLLGFSSVISLPRMDRRDGMVVTVVALVTPVRAVPVAEVDTD